MEYYLVVFSSITLANNIKKQLSYTGEYIGVIQTPRSISNGGCNYSLRFKRNRLDEVKRLCSSANIQIKGIYKEITKDGVKSYTPFL